MERVLNRRQQGDLGEASAIEWLTGRGALVFIPFGHSPHYDLIAEIEGLLLRIQVKTSTQEGLTPSGDERFMVSVATRGGNQSWSGTVKLLDPSQFDFLFVLTGRGRRWFIPSGAIDGQTSINLGGPKYAENEIEPSQSIRDVIFNGPNLESVSRRGEYPSGQRMATVNRPAYAFGGSNPPSPISSPRRIKPTNYERKPGQRGEAVINQKRRITIPQRPFFEGGLENGGKVRVRSVGPGRLLIEQIELPDWTQPTDRSNGSK
jgi:PD-(D/E)XK endonuclease